MVSFPVSCEPSVQPQFSSAVAMLHFWQAPGPADLKAGAAAAEKAKLAGAKTQRERDYIAAVDTFYTDADKLDHRTRARWRMKKSWTSCKPATRTTMKRELAEPRQIGPLRMEREPTARAVVEWVE
jgi:hypothetical protein